MPVEDRHDNTYNYAISCLNNCNALNEGLISPCGSPSPTIYYFNTSELFPINTSAVSRHLAGFQTGLKRFHNEIDLEATKIPNTSIFVNPTLGEMQLRPIVNPSVEQKPVEKLVLSRMKFVHKSIRDTVDAVDTFVHKIHLSLDSV